MPPRTEPWSSDEEIVARVLSGDREAFDLLYETYFPRVYRFALKRLRDPAEAEDVTQEVFMTVHRVLGSFQGNSSLKLPRRIFSACSRADSSLESRW